MIKIQSSNGKTFQVGGAFDAGLQMAKRLPGARFDRATKVWHTAASVEAITKAARDAHLPCDLPSGDHQTRYGTTYGRREWDAELAVSAARASMTETYIEIGQWLADALNEWANGKLADAQLRRLQTWIAEGDLEEEIEMGAIRFRSPEQQADLLAIQQSYWDRQAAAGDESDLREQLARRAYDYDDRY